MIIAIDFDQTIATGPYPECGELLPDCKDTLELLHSQGHTLILNTCRVDIPLCQAKSFMYFSRIYHLFDYINTNTKEVIKFYNVDCRKISADMYIDDKNFGGFPGWDVIRKYFEERDIDGQKIEQS